MGEGALFRTALGLPASGSGAQEGGNEPPTFSFSADSSRVITAQASSGLPRVFTFNADGTFSPSGEDSFEAVVLDLETSATTQFFVEGLEDGGNADELYFASFDSMGTPAENVVAEMPIETMPPISQF